MPSKAVGSGRSGVIGRVPSYLGTFPYLGKCRGTPTTAGVTPAVCAGVTPAMTAGVTPAVVGVGPLHLQGSPLCFDPYKLQGSPLQSWGGPCTVGVDAVTPGVQAGRLGMNWSHAETNSCTAARPPLGPCMRSDPSNTMLDRRRPGPASHARGRARPAKRAVD